VDFSYYIINYCFKVGDIKIMYKFSRRPDFRVDFMNEDWKDKMFLTDNRSFGGNNTQFLKENALVEKGVLTLNIREAPSGASHSKQFEGAEIKSYDHFSYGRYICKFAPSIIPGVNSNVFLFLDGVDLSEKWNEIDFEMVSTPDGTENQILTNYWWEPGQNDEKWFPVNHDSKSSTSISENTAYFSQFRTYEFHYLPNGIRWVIDGKLLREEYDKIFPTHSLRFIANIWIPEYTSGVNTWAGKLNLDNIPTLAKYEYFEYYPLVRE